MHPNDIAARADLARDVIRAAGQHAVEMRRDMSRIDVQAKGPRDYVTAADKAIETLIDTKLARHFGDLLLGEEYGGDHKARVLWVVDPIDGTYNYMHANPHWCVAIGLLLDGVPELSFAYAPDLDAVYTAQRGGGAFRNGRRLAVSNARYATAPLCDVGCNSKKPLGDYIGLVERLMTAGIETRRGGSGILGLCGVASGELDGYVTSWTSSWDVAGAAVIVTEAGGVLNDFFAGDGIRDGNPIIAGARWFYPALAAASALTT